MENQTPISHLTKVDVPIMAATSPETILRRNFMPSLMILGIIVCEKWTSNLTLND